MPPTPETARIFDGPAFALLSPGAPRGVFPVSLADRDDGPQRQPHDRFVIVEGLYRSELAARAAARRGAQTGGKFRRLLVQLELRGAVVIDARRQLDAMALRRGDESELDQLADLYESGTDLARINGPEGELVLIFSEAIGNSLLIVDEAIVAIPQPRERLRSADFLLAAVLALAAAALLEVLKLAVGPLAVLAVPMWLVVPVIFGAVLVHRAARATRRFVKRVLHVLQLLEHVLEMIDTRPSQDARRSKVRR